LHITASTASIYTERASHAAGGTKVHKSSFTDRGRQTDKQKQTKKMRRGGKKGDKTTHAETHGWLAKGDRK